MSHEIARLLLESGAVSLLLDPPFTFSSGLKSPIYCDNRALLSLPKERERVLAQLLALAQQQEFDVLAGTATAGIAWAAWLARELGKPMVYVRSSAKAHGKQNLIEGGSVECARVLIIEDLISTGGSALAAAAALREAGAIVIGVLAIFTYEMRAAQEAFAHAHCPVASAATFSQLVATAREQGTLTPAQQELVLAWNADPEHWEGGA